MNEREQKKKDREIRVAGWLADELNSLRGCDYETKWPCEEPADVKLVSPSRRCEEVKVQVVTAPSNSEWRLRDNLLAACHLIEELPPILRRLSVDHCSIDIQLTDRGEEHAVSVRDLNELGLVVQGSVSHRGEDARVYLSQDSIREKSPRVTALVNSISIYSHPKMPLSIDVAKAIIVPSDGRWIQEAIEAKSKMYGADEMKDLTLLIDAIGVVDAEQIDDFRRTNATTNWPFAEIWIAASCGLICLKNNTQRAKMTVSCMKSTELDQPLG
jgi:hypothetical protein